MDTCTNTVQRPDTSCTYCAALGGNVRTFSKRVGPRAKNSKYPMLTRDTCRSVDFTAWRVCPHTHIYIYTHIRSLVFEGRAESRLHTCSWYEYGFREQHERTGAVGKRSWPRVTRVCARRFARREPLSGQLVHTRVYIWLHTAGWMTAWLHWVAVNWEKLIVLRQMTDDRSF